MTANLPALNKCVLAALGAGLVILFAGSVVYRTMHPSLVVQTNQPQSGGGSMEQISALMGQLQENPGDVNALSRLAIAFSRMEAWDRAATFWQRVLDQEPANMRALQGMAMASFRMQQFETAVTYLRKALEEDPQSYRTHYNLAIVYKHFLQQPDKARSHFQTVANASEAPAELREQAKAELAQEREQ
ncbi:tetratricopeptide repeat protein [Desulfohalobium retbaense]|uniref:Tetratricopeptide TPR_2 repeat protein n=1 Tax=Desulfohalobium retbaense (strain ATCC 49708 / DSM 5692 / JCM 16813 / HR100) TaxID=485915 RepID=C8X1H8_DESRD|nr:tetratricopeptide repeat protein [Desulfohalobium retbaense]ACV68275.1 Tetratricopeptide TPR_2 repeat protein [Desulfohalobium retbaense DSM 5692]